MEQLKRHTVEEFEQMTDEVFEQYSEALSDLCFELGIDVVGDTNPFGCQMAMEQSILELIDRIKKPRKRKGWRLHQIPNSSHSVIWKADAPIEKCRRALIDVIKSYIGSGALKLNKTLKHNIDFTDEPYLFKEIQAMQFECDTEYLCVDLNDDYYDYTDWLNLEDLALEHLITIVDQIKKDKALLFTGPELFSSENIQSLILNSGLVEEV